MLNSSSQEQVIQYNTQELINCLQYVIKNNTYKVSDEIRQDINSNLKPSILVASAPKSGSTYLSNVLAKILNFTRTRLCATYGGAENDLYLPALYITKNINCISQLHIKGSMANAYYLNIFKLHTIVLVRNIFDTVISLADELQRQQANFNNFSYEFATFPFCWHSHNNYDYFDFVIDLCLPWYIDFYVSWQQLEKNNHCKLFWLTYEELMSNKHAAIAKIIDYFELLDKIKFNGGKIKVNDDIINSYYPSSDLDHNKDRIKPIGIGSKVLSTAQQDRILQSFSYYPEHDFSLLGI